MHGPVQVIGLYWSIDCRNLYCAIITQACEPNSASSAFFMHTIIKADKQNYAHTHRGKHTHTHTQRQTHTHTHTHTHTQRRTPVLAQCEKGRFSSQPCPSLSNPSVAEKALGQPFSLNPPPSKSSALLLVPTSGPWKDLNNTHILVFCHLWGHCFDLFLTLKKGRFAQSQENLS